MTLTRLVWSVGVPWFALLANLVVVSPPHGRSLHSCVRDNILHILGTQSARPLSLLLAPSFGVHDHDSKVAESTDKDANDDRDSHNTSNASKHKTEDRDDIRDTRSWSKDRYGDKNKDRDGNGTLPEYGKLQAPSPAPEPSTVLLFGVALLLTGAILRRRQRAFQK
jgi:hypothetical protein